MTIEETTREVVQKFPVYKIKCELCPDVLDTVDIIPDDERPPAVGIMLNGETTHIAVDVCPACVAFVTDRIANMLTPISRVRTYGSKRSAVDEPTDDEATP